MENLTKVCSKCKIERGIKDFGKNNRRKDFLNSSCKICRSNQSKIYKSKNAEKIKLSNKSYRDNNIEKEKKRNNDWKDNNRGKIKEYINTHRKNNPEQTKKYRDDWYNKNKGKVKERKSDWREALPDNYILSMLKEQCYPQELINNPEIIEIKRLIIQTKRLCKK